MGGSGVLVAEMAACGLSHGGLSQKEGEQIDHEECFIWAHHNKRA